MNSRLVYEDLKHLGAGHDFLMNSVRGQVGKVFKAPAAVGTVAIYLFYCLILYMNDGGRFTPVSWRGLEAAQLLWAWLRSVSGAFTDLS